MLENKAFCLKITKLKSITSQYINEECKDLNITHSEALYLKAINSQNNITQKQLSDMLGYDKARACRVLADLERQGYVIRLPDEKDSRKSSYKTTQRGKSVVEKLDKKLNNFLNTVALADIPEDQVETFFSTINKIIENVAKCEKGDQDEKTI